MLLKDLIVGAWQVVHWNEKQERELDDGCERPSYLCALLRGTTRTGAL